MKITELPPRDDGIIRVEIEARGLKGTGRVHVRYQEIGKRHVWEGDDLPAILCGALVLSFEDGALTVNGKTYQRCIHASFVPVRPDEWNDETRDIITDSGTQPIGFRARTGYYGDLTDSARDKLSALMPLLAQTYLTSEAVKEVIVARAREAYEDAMKTRIEAERDEQSARDHLAAMESLL